jgi:hypothetical protein
MLDTAHAANNRGQPYSAKPAWPTIPSVKISPIVVFNFNWSGHIPASHVKYVTAICRTNDRPIISISADSENVRAQVLASEPGVGPRLFTPACGSLGLPPVRNSALRFLRHVPKGFALWQKVRTNPLLRARHAQARWKACGELIRQHVPVSPALVFFPYLDDMIEGNLDPARVTEAMPHAWSGVFMDSSDLRVPALHRKNTAKLAFVSSARCRSLGIFDAGVLPQLRTTLPNTRVCWLPDYVDFSRAPSAPPLLDRIRGKARGRKIIGLLGHLSEVKNLELFLQVAALPENQDLFFVLAGQYEPLGVSEASRRALSMAATGSIDNVFAAPGRFGREAEFNSVLAGMDVVFAVYRNFTRSSSILIKAAFFDIPTLVADDYYMAECVRSYGLGACVPANNSATWSAALRSVLSKPPDPAGFNRFRIDFSEEIFVDRLRTLIDVALAADGVHP